jgi:PAS domain S-box-containing protein
MNKGSETKYRGLLEAAPDAMVAVNQNGEIVLLNVQAERQFGYRRDELLGQKVTNIIPIGFAERLIADDLRSVEDASAQQIDTGIELVGQRKDGSEFPSCWRTNAMVSRSPMAPITPLTPPGMHIRSRAGQLAKVCVGTKLSPQSLRTGASDLAMM